MKDIGQHNTWSSFKVMWRGMAPYCQSYTLCEVGKQNKQYMGLLENRLDSRKFKELFVL
jgi:hypothetical protein